MSYEQRGGKGRGPLGGLLGAMTDELERRSRRTVGRAYCQVHGHRTTIMLGPRGAYKIVACCDDAAQRAQAALARE